MLMRPAPVSSCNLLSADCHMTFLVGQIDQYVFFVCILNVNVNNTIFVNYTVSNYKSLLAIIYELNTFICQTTLQTVFNALVLYKN